MANQETSSHSRTMSFHPQVADTDGSHREGDSRHQHHDTNSNDASENHGDQTPLIDTPGYSGSFFCNPTSMCHKGMALVLMCSMGFGSYFCYDNPGALQKQIQEVMHVNTFQFENLYAYYSWPNVVLPIIGGYLIDKVFGIRLGAVIFATFICLGQMLTAVGAFNNSYWVMEMSRVVFGIGGESLAVAQNTYASAWFRGKALNMVFGFQLSFARVGSYANFLITGRIFDYLKDTEGHSGLNALGWTFAIAGISTILSLFGAIILAFMDKRRSRILGQGLGEQEKIELKDVTRFPATFWLITVICVAFYVTIFPFISIAAVFFHTKFGFSTTEASALQGIPYAFSAVASPLLGIMIDKTGRNVTFITLACFITLISHALFAFTLSKGFAYLAIGLMGLGYSLLAASLWPVIALVIPLHRQGTAFGIAQAIQNLGLGLISLAVGEITDKYGYFWLEVFMMGCLCFAICTSVVMWLNDYRDENFLNMTISERKRFETTEKYKLMMDMQDEVCLEEPNLPTE